MPNRILKESICRSDEVDQLSWFEEVLFYRLIVNCDDYGRFDARIKIVKNTCFPLKDVTEKDVEKALDKLSAVGLVRVYEAQGRPTLQLVTWEQHQSIRAKKSKYPAYDSTCIQMYSTDCNSPRNPIQSNSKFNTESESNADTVSKDTVCRTDVQRVIEAWNKLESYGVKGVTRVNSETKRYFSLTARMKQYGIDDVLKAIEHVKNSDFLCGKNNKGWTITFDWFVLPNNFIKVLEGNYENVSGNRMMDDRSAPLEQFADKARRWAESD